MGKTSFKDITGNKYGRLTVIELYDRNHGRIKWKCKCECGNEVIAIGNNLKNGHTQSCGCYKRDRTSETHTIHGGKHSRLYNIWTGMKTRCYDVNCSSYKHYGGRGIVICDEWLGNNGFSNFREWSLNNNYADNLSIDRKDVNKNYSPDNCRWATTFEQSNNTTVSRYITVNGVTKTAAEWERETGIKSGTLRYRIDKAHMTPEEALSRPLTNNNEKKIEYKGKQVTLTDLSRKLGIGRGALDYRLKHKIPLDKELKHDT